MRFLCSDAEGEHLLRISSEVVVAILEASRCVFNPDHFLLFCCKHIEGLLRLFRVLGPGIVPHLNRQVGHRDFRRKELRSHIGSREGARLQQFQIDELLILGDFLQLRERPERWLTWKHQRTAQISMARRVDSTCLAGY